MLVRWVPFSCRTIPRKRYQFARNRIKTRFCVLGMIEKCYLTKGSTVSMNTFSVRYHTKNWPTWVCMEWVPSKKNRLQRASHFKRKPGKHLITHRMETVLPVAWRGNKVVIVATNYLSLNPVSSTKRWSKAEKKTCRRTNVKSFQGV